MNDGYDTTKFAMLMRDAARVDAYLVALRRAVRPGCRVLDIGTGFGLFAFAAAQAGASRVVGVDPAPSIELGREIARANGFGDELELLQCTSAELVPDAPFDVIVSDLRGATPYHGHHIPAIRDARERLLAPDGVLIAASDRLMVAPVESPEAWDRAVGCWNRNPLGLDMSAARTLTANRWTQHLGPPEEVVARPATAAHIDYYSVESPHLASSLHFEMERRATVHGFSMWTNVDFGFGTAVETGPGQARAAWGRPFFPLEVPLDLAAGGRLSLELSARLVGGDYIWSWRGEGGGQAFDHSTFLGFDVSPETLRPLSPDSIPRLSASGVRVASVLSLIDGNRTTEALAESLLETFPEAFESAEEARRWLSETLRRYADTT